MSDGCHNGPLVRKRQGHCGPYRKAGAPKGRVRTVCIRLGHGLQGGPPALDWPWLALAADLLG